MTDEDEEKPIHELAAEIATETGAIRGLLEQYASKRDLERALVKEREKTTNLVDERDSARRHTTVVIALAVLLVAGVAVWALNVSSRVDREAAAREADRVQRAAQTCDQSNVTRGQINAGNDAKAALKDSIDAIQGELDGLLVPIVQTPATSDAQARALDDFRHRYEDGRAQVESALGIAAQKIAAAQVPLRDCSKPDDPSATLPTTTTTTTLGG